MKWLIRDWRRFFVILNFGHFSQFLFAVWAIYFTQKFRFFDLGLLFFCQMIMIVSICSGFQLVLIVLMIFIHFWTFVVIFCTIILLICIIWFIICIVIEFYFLTNVPNQWFGIFFTTDFKWIVHCIIFIKIYIYYD